MNKLENVPINEYEIATFAVGTSWKAEAVFRNKARGIINTATGYTGDEVQYPRLERGAESRNDLVQAVQIVFDPKIVPYERLLELFWELHGPEYSLKPEEEKEQFTSIIYCHSEKQKEKAIISRRRFERSEKFKPQINTQILAATHFFKVEKEVPQSNHNSMKKTGINRSFPKKGIQHQAR
jgi:peptide-methionine (S)-S-oxide reductase